jgi:hypothetical protein
MCLVLVAGNKRGGRPLVLARRRRAQLQQRIGEKRRAGSPAGGTGRQLSVSGAGIRSGDLEFEAGSGHQFARGRASRGAREAGWPAPLVKVTAVLPELRWQRGCIQRDIVSASGGAWWPLLQANRGTSRRERAQGCNAVTGDGTGIPIARTSARADVMTP